MSNRKLRAQVYREVEEAWQRQAGDLSIHPRELYAYRTAAQDERAVCVSSFGTDLDKLGVSVYVQLEPELAVRHDVPLLVLLDPDESGTDTVAFWRDCQTELAFIDQAVTALQLARDALVRTGYRDFEAAAEGWRQR